MLDNHMSRATDAEGENERLHNTINELESRKQELQIFLSDRDNIISELRGTVLEHEQAIAVMQETLARKEASLNSLSTETEALLGSKNELITRMQGMEREIADARSENRRLTEEIASSKRFTETLQERMAELVRTTEERQGELAQALSVAQGEAGHGAVLAQELLVMTESTREIEKQLSETRNAATALGSELVEALERDSQLELALEGSQKEVKELTGVLTSAKRREGELTSKLLASETKRQSLEEAIANMKNESRAEQVKTQTTILGLLEKIDGLQTLHDNESQIFTGRVSALEGEIEGLHLTIENVNKAREDAIAAFNSCKDDFERVQSALTAEQATCNVLRVKVNDVEEQISRMKLAKKADESNLAAVYAKWKKLQRDCLFELENAVCCFVDDSETLIESLTNSSLLWNQLDWHSQRSSPSHGVDFQKIWITFTVMYVKCYRMDTATQCTAVFKFAINKCHMLVASVRRRDRPCPDKIGFAKGRVMWVTLVDT